MAQQEGRKYDGGKNRLDLLVPGFIWEVGLVLTHGARKYGAFNWQLVEKERYLAAKYRHDLAFHSGEQLDPETGLHHLAHSACSSMFLWYADTAGRDPKLVTCKCPACNPPQNHCTSSGMGN